MSCNCQALEVVGELVGGPVAHAGQEQDGLSDADLLLQRLYAVNTIAISGHQPALCLWQEPSQPLIAPAGQPIVFTSPALSARQQQQLANDLQTFHAAKAARSNEVSVPFGRPWKISVSLGVNSLRPVQTYAIRAVDGLTVREFKRELLRQSCTGLCPMELRLFNGNNELFDSLCVPHVSTLRVVPPGQLSWLLC